MPETRNDATFEQRAALLTEWVAEKYAPPGSGGVIATPQPARGVPDPQKYVWPKAMARLSRDPKDAWARAAVAQFWDKGGDPAPHASSFYHFAAYGLARILFAFPEAVAPHREALLKQAMTEEQLFSAKGTENHVAMWRTSGYLFAQEAADEKRRAPMADWARSYADRLYRLGQGEWDSSTYAAFDVASWLNLYDYARDTEARAAAKRVVDFFAAAMALKYQNGAFAGAEKRGFSGRSTEAISTYVAWLWFGDSPKPLDEKFFSQSAIYTMTPALSRYRPTAETVALAHKADWKRIETYRVRKPNYAMTRPGEEVEVFTAGPRYAVGACVRSPIGGWGGGDTQETLWKLVARAREGTPSSAVVSGAGAGYAARSKYVGEGRSPWDQVVLHGDVLLQMTRVPQNADDLVAEAKALFDEWKRTGGNPDKVSWADPKPQSWAYLTLPAGVPTEDQGGVLYADLGGVYLAVRPLHGAYRELPEGETGVSAKERRVYQTEAARGDLTGWAIEIGDRDRDGTLADFQRATYGPERLKVEGMAVTYRDRRGVAVKAEFGASGTYTEPEYDWGTQPKWPAGAGHGRVPRLWADGKEIDLSAPGPVYEGPRKVVEASRDAGATGV